MPEYLGPKLDIATKEQTEKIIKIAKKVARQIREGRDFKAFMGAAPVNPHLPMKVELRLREALINEAGKSLLNCNAAIDDAVREIIKELMHA